MKAELLQAASTVHMELTCMSEPTHQLVNAVDGPVVLVTEPLHTLKALGEMRKSEQCR